MLLDHIDCPFYFNSCLHLKGFIDVIIFLQFDEFELYRGSLYKDLFVHFHDFWNQIELMIFDGKQIFAFSLLFFCLLAEICPTMDFYFTKQNFRFTLDQNFAWHLFEFFKLVLLFSHSSRSAFKQQSIRKWTESLSRSWRKNANGMKLKISFRSQEFELRSNYS